MSRLHQFICAHWPWLSRQCGPPAEYMVAANSAWPYQDRRVENVGPPGGMVDRRGQYMPVQAHGGVVREYEGLTKELRLTLRALDAQIDVMTAGARTSAGDKGNKGGRSSGQRPQRGGSKRGD